MSVPPIVSKRNHFNPADEYVEQGMAFLPAEFKHDKFEAWLMRYTETVIKSVAADFGTAAQRGIQQAANLLCDKDFYETKKRQRLEWKRKAREDMERQKWEKIERRECPTQEQIEEDIKRCEKEVEYHDQMAEKYAKRIEELKTKVPKNVRLIPKLTQ